MQRKPPHAAKIVQKASMQTCKNQLCMHAGQNAIQLSHGINPHAEALPAALASGVVVTGMAASLIPWAAEQMVGGLRELASAKKWNTLGHTQARNRCSSSLKLTSLAGECKSTSNNAVLLAEAKEVSHMLWCRVGGCFEEAPPLSACEACEARGRMRCQSCSGQGISNSWLWRPANDP
eukprot:scaffold130713_cov21-Tisochrysis_lutea.AAC.1